jgi:uncharacterized protein YegJ (DUF2314 family)
MCLRRSLLLLFPVVFLCSCGGDASSGSAALRDPVLYASQSDEALGEISRRARESLPVFIRRLQNPAGDEGNFCVKYPFASDPESGFSHEHLWLGDISFKDGLYYGTVLNRPYYVTGLGLGDLTVFDIDAISDWMYTKGEAVIGGLSIKYLIEGIPELDRDAGMSAYYRRFQKSPP